MRKNKKLLLASVAAMGALALGVGATSTFAWFGAQAAATQTSPAYAGTSITVDKPTLSMNETTVTITFTLEEVTSTDNNHLQLAVYGKLISGTFYSFDCTGDDKTAYDAATTVDPQWHNAYKNAAGALVWDDVSALASSSRANAYGVKGSGDNVNYKVYQIFAEADSTYKADASAQAGFAAYAKRISFTPLTSSPTKYWCVNQGDSAPAAGTVGTAVPTTKQTVDFTLAAGWNGNHTSVGYIAIYANGAAGDHAANVVVGFDTLASGGMSIGAQS